MDLSFFTWEVAVDGYRFADRQGGSIQAVAGRGLPGALQSGAFEGRRYLLPGRPLILGARARSYVLQEREPALFRRFAELAPEEDAILGFATEYGSLGSFDWVLDEEGGHHLETGERLSVWEQEISAMAWCLNLWEALRSHDVPTTYRLVGQAIKENRYRTTVRREPTGQEYHARDLMPPESSAGAELQHAMNAELADHCRPKLLYDTGTGAFRTAIAPDNLLGGMWLQLALYIEGKVQFSQCEGPGCTVWFQVHPDRSSPRKRFCSTKCRMRAHRTANGGEK